MQRADERVQPTLETLATGEYYKSKNILSTVLLSVAITKRLLLAPDEDLLPPMLVQERDWVATMCCVTRMCKYCVHSNAADDNELNKARCGKVCCKVAADGRH